MLKLGSFPSRTEFAVHAAKSSVVPVVARLLADAETPVSVLARFADRPDVFLLESAEGGERWGRYSFLGVSARAHIGVYSDAVVVRQGLAERRLAHHGRPLDVLRALVKPYSVADLPGLARFRGGLVGSVAFESAHFFESRVPSHLPPEKPYMEFMIPDAILAFDNVAHTLDVTVLAFREDAPASPDKLFEAAHARLGALLATLAKPAPATPAGGFDAVTFPAPTHPRAYYEGLVEAVKKHIVAGDVIQCVPSQSFVGAAPADLVGLYRAIRYVNPSPYLYFLKFADTTLVGSSPETMIRLDGATATLRPIAGTRPRGKTEQADRALADGLLKDEKERAEHLMLVDLGRNELGRVARPGTVQVTDLMIVERYSHVMHLVSNITAEMEPGHDAFDLFASAFPAGTLSGAPKIRAMELIEELEDEPRGAYGGAVGYFSFDGSMDFAICIRTAEVSHGRLTVRAGAGIVADSVPANEYQETVNKSGAIVRAVELLKNAERI